jgi:hypothetical protein
MLEFVGKTGTVTGIENRMYRVRLDEPVNIPGIGPVKDDLWDGTFLRTLPRGRRR